MNTCLLCGRACPVGSDPKGKQPFCYHVEWDPVMKETEPDENEPRQEQPQQQQQTAARAN